MTDFPLRKDVNGFDIQNAYALAMASDLAYESEQKIVSTCLGWGFRDAAFFDDRTTTQGFVAWRDDTVLIAFRGTEPDAFADWRTDIDAGFEPAHPVGRIHQGFNRATTSVWPAILDAVRKASGSQPTLDLANVLAEGQKANIGQRGSTCRIWITGHSLGGALSTVTAQRLTLGDVADRFPIAGIYTFGQPRVVDEALGSALNDTTRARYFRFVNNNDIVTRVPTRAMGYTHVGSFRYIDTDGALHEDLSYWQTFLDRVTGRIEDFLEVFRLNLVPDGIGDHSMTDGYLAQIKKLV